jgi:hypothetical protein
MSRDRRMRAPFAYQSRVLVEPRFTDAGVEHRVGDRPAELTWAQISAAVAAEIGEPEGVRTIVFDLVVDEPADRIALRFDADPGDAATAIARNLCAALGERAHASIKSLAVDGIPSQWFPDLASFEEAVAEELG